MKKRIPAFVLIAAVAVLFVGCKSSDYKSAMSMTESGNWADARAIFSELGDYKDSAAMITECDYNLALAAMEDGDLDAAIAAFEALGGYRDSAEQFTECKYQAAVSLYDAGDYVGALAAFAELVDYKQTDRYTVLSLLNCDQNAFIDAYVAGMEQLFAEEGLSHTLTEAEYSYDTHGAREFYVLYPSSYESNGIVVSFNHINKEHKIPSTGGQINHFSVTAYAYPDDLVDETYAGYLETAGTMMATLDDRADYEEFSATVDEEIRKLKESLGGEEGNTSCQFEYNGYDCTAAVFWFSDIKQFVFSITVPELVTD